MNSYETIIICKPTDYLDCVKKYGEMCQKFTGTKEKVNENLLGVKKLAYETRGFHDGYYAVFYWKGNAADCANLEDDLRKNDSVIKFLTVKSEEEFELQPLKCEQPPDAYDVLLGLAEYKKKGDEANA